MLLPSQVNEVGGDSFPFPSPPSILKTITNNVSFCIVSYCEVLRGSYSESKMCFDVAHQATQCMSKLLQYLLYFLSFV